MRQYFNEGACVQVLLHEPCWQLSDPETSEGGLHFAFSITDCYIGVDKSASAPHIDSNDAVSLFSVLVCRLPT